MQFYCRECDQRGTSATVFVRGDVIHYQCETCNEIVVLVDKPCVDHEWKDPYQRFRDPVPEAKDVIIFGVWRKCTKCGLVQQGEETTIWRDWKPRA